MAVLIFGALILIHELGHFVAAKKAGILVNEFSIGMGPSIFKTQRGETTYSLRLLPIGGYVSMEGEDDESHNERAFCNKSIGKRVVVIAAGAVMNLVLGYLIMLTLTLMSSGIATPIIHSFDAGAKSAEFLLPGDKIIGLNGSRVRTANDISFELIREDDGIMNVEVLRDGERVMLENVQFAMEEIPGGGKAIKLDFIVQGVEKTFLNVPVYALDWTISLVKQVWVSFLDLVSGRYGVNELSGPVGVASAIGQASSQGLQSVLILVAVITINLGVFNLLPLPALDGGRLAFLILEAIRGKPVRPEIEGYINAAGMIALLGLMAFVTFNDITKFFR